jgi:abortive infection bacteriophage resistance protein
MLTNWMHSLVYLRNLCAHHSRLWNRALEIAPLKPKELPEKDLWSNRVYSLLLVLKYLTPEDFNWTKSILKLKWLFFRNKFVDFKAMGLPRGWDRELKRKKK